MSAAPRGVLAALVAAAACSASPATGIVGDISTDLRVPAELDEVVLTVSTPDGAPLYERSFPLGEGAGRFELPMRVGFSRQGGGDGPIRITAEGRLGTRSVVSRAATLSFLLGKVLVVPLPLLAVCAGQLCTDASQTCVETGRCQSSAVDPTKLPPYHPGTNDGAAGDAPAGDGADAGAADAPPTEAPAADAPADNRAPDTAPPPPDAPPQDRPVDQGSPDRGVDARADALPPPIDAGGLNAGLVAFWTFDQVGNSYRDRSGNGNDAVASTGMLTPPPTWVATLAGHSGVIRIDLNQSWLEVASSASLNTITSAFTAAAWVYPAPNQPAAQELVLARQIGTESIYGLGLASSGAAAAFVENPIAGPSALPTGAWSHIAATYDGAFLQIYVNGVAAGPQYGVQGPPLGPTTRQLILGGRNDDFIGITDDLVGGAFDDVVLYSRALSATEIAALRAGTGPTPR